MVAIITKSPHYDFYKSEVDRAIKDCKMWNDRVRLIVYTTIITETCDGRPFGWLNYTNPREPQFADFKPNDGDPPNKSWSTRRSGGLFQQQPQYWGPDVMNPYMTTVSFLTGYRFADGRTAAGLNKVDWKNIPIEKACQAVQGSEFGDGSNYKRNIQYAQMVIDSDKEGCSMANYSDPDAMFDGVQIPYGIVDNYFEDWGDRHESVRRSLYSTNRAVYRYIPDTLAGLGNAITNVVNAVAGIPDKVIEAFGNKRWTWENQDPALPIEQQGTNNIFEAARATNGQVYRNAAALARIEEKLDKLLAGESNVNPPSVS